MLTRGPAPADARLTMISCMGEAGCSERTDDSKVIPVLLPVPRCELK